jgi:hypothetical protein
MLYLYSRAIFMTLIVAKLGVAKLPLLKNLTRYCKILQEKFLGKILSRNCKRSCKENFLTSSWQESIGRSWQDLAKFF